jgi:hypothetical protein
MISWRSFFPVPLWGDLAPEILKKRSRKKTNDQKTKIHTKNENKTPNKTTRKNN